MGSRSCGIHDSALFPLPAEEMQKRWSRIFRRSVQFGIMRLLLRYFSP
jgi:hypothetical protein